MCWRWNGEKTNSEKTAWGAVNHSFPGGFISKVLPNDPRDDAHGHAPLHIQAGDGKGHIILLSGHPVVVAGVGYSIDTVGEPDIDYALPA